MSAADDASPPAKRVVPSDPARRTLSSLACDVSPPPLKRPPGPAAANSDPDPPKNDTLADFFRSRGEEFRRRDAEKRKRKDDAGEARPAKRSATLAVRRDAVDLTSEGEEGTTVDALPAAAEILDLTHDEDEERVVGGRSPFTLTRIRDLPASENRDTVGIRDLLGDVMLKEVWVFNFCIDVDWVMAQFDPDIRDSVAVNFVHGNWKTEEKAVMEEMMAPYPNVKSIPAYMPEPFGTHHSKILVLFRRDDTVRIVIHTANMIAFDWTNMTQAAWLSPWLPLLTPSSPPRSSSPIGETFKADFLRYTAFYASRTAPLTAALKKYSFAAVRAIFVGSVPGRHATSAAHWGWPRLQRVLSAVPAAPAASPHVHVQVSSIATLGQTDAWLGPVFFRALATSALAGADAATAPTFHVIFPTADEVRQSLNGYGSGTALHARTTSAAQQRQLGYLKPLLCRWGGENGGREGGRAQAVPHIKTFLRFADPHRLDWALLTSANLSTQAWGAAPKQGEVRVSSYEAGVLVHPALWGAGTVMRPVWGRDTMPDGGGVGGADGVGEEDGGKAEKVLPLRMPYNLPLKRYAEGDQVWDKSKPWLQPDAMGTVWPGMG